MKKAAAKDDISIVKGTDGLRIIIVAEDVAELSNVETLVRKAAPNAEIKCFRSPLDALRHAKGYWMDIAYFEIEMAEMHGVDFAWKMRELFSQINMFFIADTHDYIMDYFKVHGAGYLTRPFGPNDVVRVMMYLRGGLGALIQSCNPDWNTRYQ